MSLFLQWYFSINILMKWLFILSALIILPSSYLHQEFIEQEGLISTIIGSAYRVSITLFIFFIAEFVRSVVDYRKGARDKP